MIINHLHPWNILLMDRSWFVDRHLCGHAPKKILGLLIECDRDFEHGISTDSICPGRDADHLACECFIQRFNGNSYRRAGLYLRNIAFAQVRGFQLQLIQCGKRHDNLSLLHKLAGDGIHGSDNGILRRYQSGQSENGLGFLTAACALSAWAWAFCHTSAGTGSQNFLPLR